MYRVHGKKLVRNLYKICTKSVQINLDGLRFIWLYRVHGKKLVRNLYKNCTKSVQNWYVQKAGFLAKINRQQKLAGRGVKKLRFLENSQIDNVPDNLKN